MRNRSQCMEWGFPTREKLFDLGLIPQPIEKNIIWRVYGIGNAWIPIQERMFQQLLICPVKRENKITSWNNFVKMEQPFGNVKNDFTSRNNFPTMEECYGNDKNYFTSIKKPSNKWNRYVRTTIDLFAMEFIQESIKFLGINETS